MSRSLVVAALVAMALVALGWWLRGRPASAEPAASSPAQVSKELRERLLKGSHSELRIAPDGSVWGVLMETGHEKAAVTVVALADGAASIYFSTGGGFIGGETKPNTAAAAKRMVQAAGGFLSQLTPTQEFPLPAFGRTRFYVLTTSGVLTAEAAEDDLGYKRHTLAPLFYAGQDVITGLRLASEMKKE